MDSKTLNSWQELAQSEINGSQKDSLLSSDISEEQVQNAYRSAYDLYQKKSYGQAVIFFHFLVCVRTLDKKYWKGLGACQHALKHYVDALQSYQFLQELCKDQPDPYISIYQADCYFALDQIELGLKMLEEARLIAESSNNTQILDHVSFMREMWSK